MIIYLVALVERAHGAAPTCPITEKIAQLFDDSVASTKCGYPTPTPIPTSPPPTVMEQTAAQQSAEVVTGNIAAIAVLGANPSVEGIFNVLTDTANSGSNLSYDPQPSPSANYDGQPYVPF